ncbi:unnamed protein product, partial [marine sediment metagenome]
VACFGTAIINFDAVPAACGLGGSRCYGLFDRVKTVIA